MRLVKTIEVRRASWTSQEVNVATIQYRSKASLSKKCVSSVKVSVSSLKICLITAFSHHLRRSEPFDQWRYRSLVRQYTNKRAILTILHFFGALCKNPRV
jgi:hypothetical protein